MQMNCVANIYLLKNEDNPQINEIFPNLCFVQIPNNNAIIIKHRRPSYKAMIHVHGSVQLL